jgi:hypothetical protein
MYRSTIRRQYRKAWAVWMLAWVPVAGRLLLN